MAALQQPLGVLSLALAAVPMAPCALHDVVATARSSMPTAGSCDATLELTCQFEFENSGLDNELFCKVHVMCKDCSTCRPQPIPCPPLNVDASNMARCGMNFGRCNGNQASCALYCNEDNGWCGDTEDHRLATPGDLYDFRPRWSCTLGDFENEENDEPWWERETFAERWRIYGARLTESRQGEAFALSKGFENHGNSCYMATALQMMIHMPGLLEYVTEERHLQYARSRDELNWRRRLVLLLKDVKEIYERIEGATIPSEVTGMIRQRFIELGLPVDTEFSTEFADDVIYKILGAFPAADVPGFSQLEITSGVANCDPQHNPFVRPIPGSKMTNDDLSMWNNAPDGSCGSKKLNPPSVARVTLPDQADLTLLQLLTREVTIGSLGAEEVAALYNKSKSWARCDRDLRIILPEEPFDEERPRSVRWCEKPQSPHIVNGAVIEIGNVRAVQLDGNMNIAVYQWQDTETWVVPDQQLVMLSVHRRSQTTPGIREDGVVKLIVRGSQQRLIVKAYQLAACTIHRSNHWWVAARLPDGGWVELNDGLVLQYGSMEEAISQCNTFGQFFAFERIFNEPWSAIEPDILHA